MLFKGKGTIWNPQKNKPLCKFVDGIFETDDKYIIDKLIQRSKEFSDVILQEAEYDEHTKDEPVLPFIPDDELVLAPVEEKPKKGRPSKKG